MMSTTRHDPPALSRRWLAPGGRVERHYHDGHQLLYPKTGAVSVTTAAGTWMVPPLRAIWLPAGQPHATVAHGRTELRAVLFPPAARAFPAPTLLAVSPLLREVLLALTLPGEPAGARRAHLETVALDPHQPAPETSCYLPEPADDRLAGVAAALRADPADPRTLAEFGRAVGAGERTLSRLFRRETGMTFPQWRAQLRLQAALVDLAAGTAVGAVAYRCGYGTPSAFIASFRAAFGVTPGAYRGRAR